MGWITNDDGADYVLEGPSHTGCVENTALLSSSVFLSSMADSWNEFRVLN